MILIYLFALLTQPTDRLICDLWTRALTQEALVAACPAITADLRVDVYTVDMSFVCSRPANLLANIQSECNLNGALDEYVLRIVKPAHQEIICMVESNSGAAPTEAEISQQCPEAKNYVIQFAGTRQESTTQAACPYRPLESGAGLYQQPAAAGDLATQNYLPMLAGELIWYGFVNVTTCGGMSGVDLNHVATPCGLAASYPAVIAWQNQYDPAIYEAALTYNVPARLLKRIMQVESQFWHAHAIGADGEIGMMQVTDNGLDTLLRFDPWLDTTYQAKSDDAQAWARAFVRHYFNPESVQHVNQNIPYFARLLAAYHCRALSINPALTGADEWRQTVIDYNGTPEYLLLIEN